MVRLRRYPTLTPCGEPILPTHSYRVHHSPSETQSEPKDTLIDALPAYATGAGYRREPTKVWYASVAVQLHVRDIGAGVIEVRCIGEVECFRTELQSYVFRE